MIPDKSHRDHTVDYSEGALLFHESTCTGFQATGQIKGMHVKKSPEYVRFYVFCSDRKAYAVTTFYRAQCSEVNTTFPAKRKF